MSPQKENGFTPIANELFEAFYRCKLLEYERVIMMCIWRKTYGWSKKEDWIANSQFFEETGIPKPHITRTIKKLREKNIIVKDAKRVTIQKDYSKWLVEWRVTSPGNRVTSPGNKKLPHQVPTKERKHYTKENGETSSPNLKDNTKDMAWNKSSDDLEEGVVDFDGDGETTKEKKTPTKKYPNAPAIRKIFQEVLGRNDANWKINKTQLLSCENLYTERGEQKVKNALEWYKEHKDIEFCPKVDSPYDLDSKYVKLSQFKTKYEN